MKGTLPILEKHINFKLSIEKYLDLGDPTTFFSNKNSNFKILHKIKAYNKGDATVVSI